MNTRQKLEAMKQTEERNRQHEQEWRKKQMEQEPKYRLSLAEREVHIRFDAEERIAHIYASDPVYIRRLDALCEEHPETYKCVKVDQLGYFKQYEAPSDRIRFGKPASEAKKQASRNNSPFSSSPKLPIVE